jgi:hypothetical protein
MIYYLTVREFNIFNLRFFLNSKGIQNIWLAGLSSSLPTKDSFPFDAEQAGFFRELNRIFNGF